MYMSPAAMPPARHTSEIGRHYRIIYRTPAGFEAGAREGRHGSAGGTRCAAISRRERVDPRSPGSARCFIQADLQASVQYPSHLERRLFWQFASRLGTDPE